MFNAPSSVRTHRGHDAGKSENRLAGWAAHSQDAHASICMCCGVLCIFAFVWDRFTRGWQQGLGPGIGIVSGCFKAPDTKPRSME
jgi:hypothetical protein